jgi:hypothetical protein
LPPLHRLADKHTARMLRNREEKKNPMGSIPSAR